MKRIFNEDSTMLDSQRQVSGIGGGAREEMLPNGSVPTKGTDGKSPTDAPPVLPFEVNATIPKIADIFEKLIELRKSLEDAKKNPSIKESQLIGLDKSVSSIDKINKRLLKIPDYLSVFILD